MLDIALMLTFARELSTRSHQPRGVPPSTYLEPELVMRALSGAGGSQGRFAAGYLYHTANIAQVIYGSTCCVDLGAAPGCQLLQLAPFLPDTEFVGVDNNPGLIKEGQRQSEKLKVGNVRWLCDDITKLETFEENSVDAVISTMTLHDLGTLDDVNQCLSSVARILCPGGALYIEDYGRLKSLHAMAYFNTEDGKNPKDAFSELNACSLRAAFTKSELQLAFETNLPAAAFYSTYLIPFLNVARTGDKKLPDDLLAKFRQLRVQLPRKKREDLDNLRKFFNLGGWPHDAFE